MVRSRTRRNHWTRVGRPSASRGLAKWLVLFLVTASFHVVGGFDRVRPASGGSDFTPMLAAAPVASEDLPSAEGRNRGLRPASRPRFEAVPVRQAEQRLRLRLRLSTMECPDDRPPSQTLLSIRLRHLRMGNSDADYLSPAGA